MKRRYLKRGRNMQFPKLELTPLIDVIFILVIFFAVTTTFVQEKKGIKLSLPNAVSVESPKKSVIISIDRNQRVYWNSVPISESVIADKVSLHMKNNPDQGIVLQADEQTPYNRVIYVLDSIRRSGCSNVMLEAEIKT